jgi:hypothetical protein
MFMTARCQFKRAVLECVQKMGRAKSAEVAKQLRHRDVSVENVSMTLLKCKRQGLVERKPFKRGRAHGYVYWTLKKGEDRLEYYRKFRNKQFETGTVDIVGLVQSVHHRVKDDLLPFYHEPDVDGQGTFQRMRHAYLFFSQADLTAAFAAKRLLGTIAPETMAKIDEAASRSSGEDALERACIIWGIEESNSSNRTPQFVFECFLVKVMQRRFDEQELCLFLIHNRLEEAEKEAALWKIMYETRVHFYKTMYEIEKLKSPRVTRLISTHPTVSRSTSTAASGDIANLLSETRQAIREADKLIAYLIKDRNKLGSCLLWTMHFLVASEEERVALKKTVRRLADRVDELETSNAQLSAQAEIGDEQANRLAGWNVEWSLDSPASDAVERVGPCRVLSAHEATGRACEQKEEEHVNVPTDLLNDNWFRTLRPRAADYDSML